MTTRRRIILLANPAKPEAAAFLNSLTSFARARCEVVSSQLSLDVSAAVREDVDRVIVLGGDGTLLGVARAMDAAQLPLIGVNLGKLGYLTEFSTADLCDDFDRAISDDTLIRRRTLLEVKLFNDGACGAHTLAVNDCVIHAGPPYRMIALQVRINGDRVSEFRGDGLIISTPIGSTAHNLSAGGPILQADIDAIVLTPLCPHSLTHRPIVVASDAVIEVRFTEVNPGTTAIIDGQTDRPLHAGARLTIQRFGTDMKVVRNPSLPAWHKLVSKLHWGRAPEA